MKRSEQIVELMDDVKKIISQMAVVGRSDLCNGPAGQMFRKVQSDNQGWKTEF